MSTIEPIAIQKTRSRIATLAASIAFLFLINVSISAQRALYPSDVKSMLAGLDRTGSEGMFRHVLDEGAKETAPLASAFGADLNLLPVSTFASYNSSYPFGDNDGALWQGRGVSGISRAGAELSWGWGFLKIAPEWWFAQNQSYPFNVPNVSPGPTGDYWWGLDRLHAYGTSFYQTPTLGQSELRLNYGGFTVGFGNENIKLGPAEIQNVILSGNAAGFPLLDIGTDGPIKTPIGSIDARLFWGQNTLSQWFDADPATNKFLWCGGAFSYAPPFLDTMSFGVTRVFHSPWSTVSAWKLFELFDDNLFKGFRLFVPLQANGEDDVDQVLSATWEWRIPSVGARVYAEFARNDHASDIIDLLMQPTHSYGYVLGMQQKAALSSSCDLLFSGEMADVGNDIGSTIRPTGSWYRHTLVDNNGIDGGYTNGGQLLGSPMGPGSNSQEINAYLNFHSWFIGLGLQRLIMDADYFYSIAKPWGYYGYNMQLTGTLRFGMELQSWLEFGAAFAFTQNWNRDFSPGLAPNGHVELAFRVSGI